MRRLPRLAVTAGVLALAATLAAPAFGSHGGQSWSGRWSSSFGGFELRHRTDDAGRAYLLQLGGVPCTEPSDYFVGTYAAGSDTGVIRGCTVGGANRLVGRYRNTTGSTAGRFDIALTSATHWSGTWADDAGPGGVWQGDFIGHIADDGASDPSMIPTANGVPPACSELWWSGEWRRRERSGMVRFFQTGSRAIAYGVHTWDKGGAFTDLTLSPDCITITGRFSRPAGGEFSITLKGPDAFDGWWKLDGSTGPDGDFSGTASRETEAKPVVLSPGQATIQVKLVRYVPQISIIFSGTRVRVCNRDPIFQKPAWLDRRLGRLVHADLAPRQCKFVFAELFAEPRFARFFDAGTGRFLNPSSTKPVCLKLFDAIHADVVWALYVLPQGASRPRAKDLRLAHVCLSPAA